MFAITYSNELSLGNLITLSVLGGGLIAFYWRQNSKIELAVEKLSNISTNNTESIKDVKDELKKMTDENILFKVQLLWDTKENFKKEIVAFMRDRGDAELVKRGARKNSPVDIASMPDHALIVQAYEPFIKELSELENELELDVTKDEDAKMIWGAVAIKFGNRFATEICPVIGLHKGGCVSAAIAVLREKKQSGCI